MQLWGFFILGLTPETECSMIQLPTKTQAAPTRQSGFFVPKFFHGTDTTKHNGGTKSLNKTPFGGIRAWVPCVPVGESRRPTQTMAGNLTGSAGHVISEHNPTDKFFFTVRPLAFAFGLFAFGRFVRKNFAQFAQKIFK